MSTTEKVWTAILAAPFVYGRDKAMGGCRTCTLNSYCGRGNRNVKKAAHNKGKGRGLAWIRAHVSHEGDDCLVWPMTRDWAGYGQVGVNGKLLRAHRVMCELAKGPPPSPEHEAAHSCGRGHFGCVNPRHLSWKTAVENKRDKIEHGTAAREPGRVGRRKLTPDDVAELRKALGSITIAEIAARFGVSRATVRQIRDGETWRSDNKHRMLEPSEVIAIRQGLADGMTPLQLSTHLGINRSSIYRIRDGSAHKHVESCPPWGGQGTGT